MRVLSGRQFVRYNYRHEVKLIRVSIIAPAIAIRTGLRALLSDDPQINVIAEAASIEEIEEALDETDIIVWAPVSTMDLESTFSKAGRLMNGEMPALLLMHNDPKALEYLTRLPRTGVGLAGPGSYPSGADCQLASFE